MDIITENRIQEIMAYLDARKPKNAPHTKDDAIEVVVEQFIIEKRIVMNHYLTKKITNQKGVTQMHEKDKFVGIQLFGFCNGFFGRDSYEDKIIIASGDDWLVAKNDNGISEFASFGSGDIMEELIADWKDDHQN